MIKTKLLTEKAFEVIAKKLRNNKLTQQDSNYLSRFVRPKLREISLIDAKALLNRLNYNPKAMSLERKIKKIIINNIPSVDSIILCGSAVQTNYKEYNDIDVIVATKKIISKSIKKKRELIADIEELGKKLKRMDMERFLSKRGDMDSPSKMIKPELLIHLLKGTI